MQIHFYKQLRNFRQSSIGLIQFGIDSDRWSIIEYYILSEIVVFDSCVKCYDCSDLRHFLHLSHCRLLLQQQLWSYSSYGQFEYLWQLLL